MTGKGAFRLLAPVEMFESSDACAGAAAAHASRAWRRDPSAAPPRRPRARRSANNKLVPQDAQLGQLQRMIRSLTVDSSDAFVYAGTTSGDVLQVGWGQEWVG